MLVTLNEVLAIAEEKGIAIGSFNTPNMECLEAVIGAAESLDLPVIIQFAECHESLTPFSYMAPAMIAMAKQAKVKVCAHADHGESMDYLRKALDMGFTSIMYDGSVLSYEENAANTRLAVEMAKKYGASVEAELGSMGKRESGSGDADDDDTKIYTDPALAAKFVQETGIDALACSFGTTHGIYLTKPKLDFDVVKNVRRETGGIPVVMHGGSGVTEDEFARAIRAGVRKINYFTYMDKAGGTAAGQWMENLPADKPLFFSDLAVAAKAAMRENICQAMKMFALR